VETARHDGTPVILTSTKSPLHDDEGKVIGVIGISRDITHIRRTERAIVASEARYRAVFDHANDALFIVGGNGRILEANQAACELLGRAHDQVCDHTLLQMGLPDLSDPLLDGGTEAAPSDGLVREVRLPTGKSISVEFRKRSFESSGEWLDLLTGRDLTRQLEAQMLDRQQRAQIAHLSRVGSVGELASSLAHEINQPLTAILSYAGVLVSTQTPDGRSTLTPTDRHSYLSEIERQAVRAAEIIRGIRRFIQKEPANVSLNELNDPIRNALAILQEECRNAQVQVEADLDPHLPPTQIDSVQIEQVLINLVQNAVEAMRMVPPDRRTLRVTSRVAGPSRVEVLVGDTGPGAPPDVADRLFESFFTTRKDGLGLGLPICRSIIETHGGTLNIRSNSPDGMVVSFTLPVEPA
jgi:PAS domain S-box-containing protein